MKIGEELYLLFLIKFKQCRFCDIDLIPDATDIDYNKTLAVLRNLIVGGPLLAELAPITGPMYQLFVFFMVTDPRTTVGTKRGRMIVVAIVAVLEAVFRLGGDFQIGLLRPFYVSPPILALSIVGPIAMFLDLRRQPAVRPTAAPAVAATVA